MSSPALPALRPPDPTVAPAGDPGTAPSSPRTPLPAVRCEESRPAPETVRTACDPVAPRIPCGREGLVRARSFTRATLCAWSLGHRREDATPVMTELAAGAVPHAAPRCADVPDVRLGLRLEPAHVPLTVSDPDDHPPVPAPGAALDGHGRGLRVVDARSEGWGWTPAAPAGKTVWARLSAHPSI